MTKRSKGFGKPVHVQKEEIKSQKELGKFAKKLMTGPLGDRFPTMALNPTGVPKMSEVLEEFVKPYLESVQNHEQRQKMITMAAIAWNIALLPEESWESDMEPFLSAITDDDVARQGFQEILLQLISRKLLYFSDDRRSIVDFQVIDRGSQFHLSVASVMPGDI